MMMNKYQSSTLQIILAGMIIGTILALSVAVLITQEANAEYEISFQPHTRE
jgi:hypothetical protein